MKKILLTVLIATSVCSFAFSQANNKPETLALTEKSFDFGKIQQGKPVTHDFVFTNNGTDTIRLSNVQASCGCTTPVWKKDPVAPNNTSNITVGYNAASEGRFEKTVTIFYNDGKTNALTIKGEVVKLPAGPAPVNNSIQLLKQ